MLQEKMLTDSRRESESTDKMTTARLQKPYSTPSLSRFGKVHELARGSGGGFAEFTTSKNE